MTLKQKAPNGCYSDSCGQTCWESILTCNTSVSQTVAITWTEWRHLFRTLEATVSIWLPRGKGGKWEIALSVVPHKPLIFSCSEETTRKSSKIQTIMLQAFAPIPRVDTCKVARGAWWCHFPPDPLRSFSKHQRQSFTVIFRQSYSLCQLDVIFCNYQCPHES